MKFVMIPLVLAGAGIQAGCRLLLRGNTYTLDPERAILILLGVYSFYLDSGYLTSAKRVVPPGIPLGVGAFSLPFPILNFRPGCSVGILELLHLPMRS